MWAESSNLIVTRGRGWRKELRASFNSLHRRRLTPTQQGKYWEAADRWLWGTWRGLPGPNDIYFYTFGHHPRS